MTRVVLNDDQARTVRQATGEMLDEGGVLVGYLTQPLFTPDEIAEAERRAASAGPWHTTAEVLSHLRALEQE
jgi:hypothetical protein